MSVNNTRLMIAKRVPEKVFLQEDLGGGITIGGVCMSVISMKQLLEAGVHFGHQTRRWNPKMAPYIFTERNGIYIIDLQQTVEKLEQAYEFVKKLAMEGGHYSFLLGPRNRLRILLRKKQKDVVCFM